MTGKAGTQAAVPATAVAGTTPVEPIFSYRGFNIPERLVRLTGGGPETWDPISRMHMDEYARYCPIDPRANVVEIGCGVGRDAIQLTSLLTPEGQYTGVDVIEPSIRWCSENITPRFPNFKFVHVDVQSDIHNPGGKMRVSEVMLPAEDCTVDRIILQSVFTHMFREQIIPYLREFRRMLKPDGLVFASLFLLDDESRRLSRLGDNPLRFEHPYGEGCFINDVRYPEGAVAFSAKAMQEMLAASRMKLAQPIYLGAWCGRPANDGQDVAILARG